MICEVQETVFDIRRSVMFRIIELVELFRFHHIRGQTYYHNAYFQEQKSEIGRGLANVPFKIPKLSKLVKVREAL